MSSPEKPPSKEPLRAVLCGDEEQPIALVLESKQEQTSPSIIVSIGVVLLFAVGFFLIMQTIVQQPSLTPDSITFTNVPWREGPASSGHITFTSDHLTCRVVLTETTATIITNAESDVVFEQGLRLTVNAHVEHGQPDVYGVIFHLSQGSLLRLSIDEWAGEAQVEQANATSVNAITEPQNIGSVLNSAEPDRWHSICMVIKPERVDIWLNRQPVLGFDGENLAAGRVGVFAASSTEKDSLHAEVNFRDFEATRLSLECP